MPLTKIDSQETRSLAIPSSSRLTMPWHVAHSQAAISCGSQFSKCAIWPSSWPRFTRETNRANPPSATATDSGDGL